MTKLESLLDQLKEEINKLVNENEDLIVERDELREKLNTKE